MSVSALLALLGACLMWGTTGVVAAGMTADVPTLAIGAFTMGVGGILLAAITARDVRSVLANSRARPWVVLGGLGVLVYPLAFYAAMHAAGVAVGNSVALGSGPLFAALLESTATRTLPNRRWFVALGVAALGLVGVGVGRASGDPVAGTGVALAVLAGLAYALYSVAGSRIIAAGENFRGSMGSVFGAGSLPLLGILLATGAPLIGNGVNLLRGGYLAFGPLVVAYLLFGYALTRASASLVTLVTLLEPVFATVLAVIILGETLPPVGWAGIVLLLVGVAIATLRRGPASHRGNGEPAP